MIRDVFRIPPQRRCLAFSGALALHVCVAACLLTPVPTSAAEAENLGEVRLTLTKQPPPPPAERRPRVAMFLIDCSSSMREGINGKTPGPGNPQRWAEVRRGLEQVLRELYAASEGIEVRIRFFGTFLDCLGQGQVAAKLDKPADIDILMAKVPADVPNKTECTTTALFESTARCVEQLREENRQRNFEWWMFGVFSDGGNAPLSTRVPKATTSAQERDEQLEAMRAEGSAPPIAWIVGPDAEKVAGEAYGPSEVKEIGKSFPVPPQQLAIYTLDLAGDQAAGVQIDRAAQSGRQKLSVAVAGDFPDGTELVIAPKLLDTSPFRLLSRAAKIRPGSPAVFELELPQGIDRAKGVSATLAFRASPAAPNETLLVEGEPRVTFKYPADGTLPINQWTLDHDPAEKKGVKTLFAANPGQAKSPQWVFKGPNGEEEREDGLYVKHAFPTAGRWTCTFTCISESGEKLAREAEPIEIIDASFSLDPQRADIDLEKSATFRIVPAPGATSPAVYSCLFDGQPVELGSDGKSITLTKSGIDQIGRHTLSVVAKSRVGDLEFDWRDEAQVLVKASPRVAIVPGEFVEGNEYVPVEIQASGEIGGAVTVFANGKRVDEFPLNLSSDVTVDQVVAKIPIADLTAPNVDIVVQPKLQGACPEATATLKGRAADFRAKMKSPKPGEKASAKGGRQIVLEPSGDSVGSVGDAEFLVALTPKGEPPSGDKLDDLIANEANRWTVAMPRQIVGEKEVWAKPSGGRLRSDLFPEGKGWDKIGSLTVVPEAQWIPFLLSLLGILGALYFAWTALWGNHPRHWVVQTSVRDPGLQQKGFVDAIRLKSRLSAPRSSPAGKDGFLPYGGWPLSNWLPTLPSDPLRWFDLPSKNTTIFLWQLAQRHKSEKWLQRAAAANPTTAVVVKGAAPEWPFAGLPSHRSSEPWTDDRVRGPFLGPNGTEYSETHRLTSLHDHESLWIRVKQPRKSHLGWEHWALVMLVAMALVAVAYLAHIFLHYI